jgi:hypothetical protein
MFDRQIAAKGDSRPTQVFADAISELGCRDLLPGGDHLVPYPFQPAALHLGLSTGDHVRELRPLGMLGIDRHRWLVFLRLGHGHHLDPSDNLMF